MPVAPMSYHIQWLRRQVVLPSGLAGVVTGWAYDRLVVQYANKEGGTVTIHPNLVEVADGKPRPAE